MSFLAFSHLSCLVAGRVKSEESDQKVTKEYKKVKKSDKKSTFLTFFKI